ncbi:MAG TPA: ribosome silencing factor [Rhodothermales bacterium]
MNDVRNRATPPRPAGKKRKTRNPVQLLARTAVDAILDKKGTEISVMDLRGISGVADFFVVCTGGSDIQIKAIADAVQEHVRLKCEEKPWHVEGYEHLQWVLLDFVDLVVHVFSRDKRSYYDLERLWGDAPIEHVADDGSSADVQVLRTNSASRAS